MTFEFLKVMFALICFFGGVACITIAIFDRDEQ